MFNNGYKENNPFDFLDEELQLHVGAEVFYSDSEDNSIKSQSGFYEIKAIENGVYTLQNELRTIEAYESELF